MNVMNKKIIIFAILNLICCSNKPKDWYSTNFDERISKNDSIKLMNNFFDPEELYYDSISTNKKTSFIIYNNDYNKNICNAEIKNDTLKINIGYSTGFSSQGFNIIYFDKKHRIQPFHATDNISITVDENGREIKPKPTRHFFNNSKLILDKTEYKKGDSIYGFIDFSSLEIDDITKSTHKGRGYFRTKIQ